jgi:hypothetical protein
VRLVGLGAALAGIAALRRHRRAYLAEGIRKPDPTVVALRTAASILVGTAILATFAPRVPMADAARRGLGGRIPLAIPAWGLGRGSGDNELPPQVWSQDSPIRSTPRDVTFKTAVDPGIGDVPGGALVRRAMRALPLLILVLLAMRILSRRKPRWEMELPEPEEPLAPAEAAAAVGDALAEVSGDPGDPRVQITLAYRRLLAALERAQAPRAPQEAPHEHLYRVLGPLGVRPEPLHRLTDLYVVAQFSERRVGEPDRAAAAAALETSLADLRVRHAPA